MRRKAVVVAPLALFCCVAAAAPAVGVHTAVVKARVLSTSATAYGRLVPDPHALEWLTAAQAGRITAVLVTPGSRVTRGQALVRVAPTPKSRAAFESARSAVASARAKLKQTQTLESNGLATRSDLESARSALASAKAQLAALQAEGGGAKPHSVKASSAGVVTKLPVGRGQWVAAGGRIAALSSGALWVRLGLDPTDAARVGDGAAVQLRPVFGHSATIASRVVQVAAQADPATGLVDAEVPVPATASGPLPGEWVKGTINLRSAKLPAVPRSSVLKDKAGYYVFVVRKQVAHRVGVKPLMREGGLVGLSGVKPGALVVTQGNFELHDGEAVREAGR